MKTAAALLVLAVLLSGCQLPDLFKKKPLAPQEQAAALAREQTTEAGLMAALGEGFAKTDNCSAEEYLRIAKLLGNAVANEGGQVETDPVRAKEIVATTKACKPRVKVSMAKKAEGLYTIEYRVLLDPACPRQDLVEKAKGMRVLVESNALTGKAKVVEGEMDAKTRAKIEGLLPGLPLMGNCAAAFILGSGELGTAAP